MSWDRSLDLFVNVGTSPECVLLASKSTLQPGERPVLVSGDKHKVRIWFLLPSGATPAVVALGDTDTLILAGKARVSDSALLFSCVDLAKVTDGDGTHYDGTLDLNTEELLNALANEAAIVAVVDIEVRNAANTQRRSRQFPVRINKQAFSGEPNPDAAYPYPASNAILTIAADSDQIKRGVIDLVAGQYAGIEIAFATVFATAPTTVKAWILKKAGAPIVTAHENHDSVTAALFTVDLANPIPDDAAEGDYKLAWLAIL